MYKIFLVEDDEAIAAAVVKHIASWGWEPRRAEDLTKVMEEFTAFSPHLVLLDIGLPYRNGYHWCTEIRKLSRVPIVFLSSASDNMNIVMAMNMGGDDFIPKPFDLEVLSAKIQAILRRTYDFGSAPPLLEARGATLDTGDNTLHYRDQKLELTRNEYRILQVLLEQKGPHGFPGHPDAQALGNGQLRGRKYPDGEYGPAAAETGRHGPGRPDPHKKRVGLSDRVRLL